MNQISIAAIIGLCLAVCLVSLGCSRRSKVTTPTPVQQEASKPLALPFLGDDISPASAPTLAGLQPFYRWGFILLVAGALAGAVCRSWRVAGSFAGSGILGISIAVLFSENPRASLVLPVICTGVLVVVLLWLAVKYLVKLWQGYRAVEKIVPTVEELDTGPKSPGRKLKKALEIKGVDGVVRKGIRYIKAKLNGENDNPSD